MKTEEKVVELEAISKEASKEPIVDFNKELNNRFNPKSRQEVLEELSKKMVGEVIIRPLFEASWPTNKDDFRMGTEKFTKYTGAGETLVPTSSRSSYIIEFSAEEALVLEEILHLPKNTLSKQISNQYWSADGRIMINPISDSLNLAKPEDYIKYCVLLGHKRVANSEAELSKWPHAEWVMVNLNDVKSTRNKFNEDKGKAYIEYSKLDDERRRKLAYVLGHNVESMTDQDISEIMYSVIEATPHVLLDALKMKNTNELVIIQKAVAKAMFIENSNGITYGDHFLGVDRGTAAAMLADPKNQMLRVQIESVLNRV